MNIKAVGYLFMITTLLTGTLLPIMLAIAKNMNIFEFFLLVYAIQLPFSIILVYATKSQRKFIQSIKDIKLLSIILFIGLLTYTSIELLLLYAEHFVSASLATVVFRTSPLLMLLFIPSVLMERLSKGQLVALLLGFAGLYIALMNSNFPGVFNNSNIFIILLLVVAALGYALANVLGKKYSFNMVSGILIFNISFLVFFLATH